MVLLSDCMAVLVFVWICLVIVCVCLVCVWMFNLGMDVLDVCIDLRSCTTLYNIV